MTARVVVRKYGGEALADAARIRVAASQVVDRARQVPLVVVTSARSGVTDHLLTLLREVGGEPGTRSGDRAVSAGEIVSAALLAAAIQQAGRRAVALDGREAGLVASGDWAEARLRRVRPRRLRQLLSAGVIPVVAGFQARRRRGLATLGRGGSDLTAVALAAALGGECELIKDVSALHTADPRLCHDALPLRVVDHAFLVELARAGSKVCHPRAALLAQREDVAIRFAHFQAAGPGTAIGAAPEARAVVIRPGVSILAGYAGAELDGSALRRLLRRLQRVDAGAELTAARCERGWQVTVFLADAARARAAALWPEAGVTVSALRSAAVALVSVVGNLGADECATGLREATLAAGVKPVRIARLGRRLIVAVEPDHAVALLHALHSTFVLRHAGADGCAA